MTEILTPDKNPYTNGHGAEDDLEHTIDETEIAEPSDHPQRQESPLEGLETGTQPDNDPDGGFSDN